MSERMNAYNIGKSVGRPGHHHPLDDDEDAIAGPRSNDWIGTDVFD